MRKQYYIDKELKGTVKHFKKQIFERDNKLLLYIDILGFTSLIEKFPDKIISFYKVIDELIENANNNLSTIVFSDTILVFNKKWEHSIDFYLNLLCEFIQELHYDSILRNIYFRAVLTVGNFNYQKLRNIEMYFGNALVETYLKEKQIQMTGLFINKNLSKKLKTYKIIKFENTYDCVIMTKAISNIYKITKSIPCDIDILEGLNLNMLELELLFFREINFLRIKHPDNKVKEKFSNTYSIYKNAFPEFFKQYEILGFNLDATCYGLAEYIPGDQIQSQNFIY